MSRAPWTFLLALGFAGCAAPDFVIEGPFVRSLKEFRRLEIRPVQVALQSANPAPEQLQGAKAFAAEFGDALLHRLHRRGRLDAVQGPTLVLECRVLKYEWKETAGNESVESRTNAVIQVSVSFRDESGARFGSGSVTATGAGSTPRDALEDARNGAVASVTKFIRKGMGRTKEPEEPPEPEIRP